MKYTEFRILIRPRHTFPYLVQGKTSTHWLVIGEFQTKDGANKLIEIKTQENRL